MFSHLVAGTEDEDYDDRPIRWSNIIFLPFAPIWKFIIIVSVIIKCILGPLSSIYTIHCMVEFEENIILNYLKHYYVYFGEFFYIVDTFLYIIHKQVTDEALRREHLPKNAALILMDIIGLIPFHHIVSSTLCSTVQLWPNVLAFSEMCVSYRLVQYFSLTTTHSRWKLIIGYTLCLLIYVNCVTCFLLLLTVEGLCGNCRKGVYDWRSFFTSKFNVTKNFGVTYLYGSALILSITLHKLIDETRPSTYLEFLLFSILLILGYVLIKFVIVPKLFAEGILSMRQICRFHTHVTKIIEETKRRNPSPLAHLSVENFYNLIWTKQYGITKLPEVITELPRHLIVNIRQDLVWPVFYHSPTFRDTSMPYKRWLCGHIHLEFKLPGEKFYSGLQCYNNLYYIKSGIVQFISSEDNITSILSVTSGTIFGDVSFIVPSNRQIILKCLTYCEVFSLSRADIIRSLHKFPEDRRKIFELVNERLNHAHTLYNCKSNVRGLDRTEDEGISWVKKRWWEINNSVKYLKKIDRNKKICSMCSEETNYHCAKYIGQLALSTNVQLQTNSMFVKLDFPWILAPHSVFGDVWYRIITCTVYIVLLTHPPMLIYAEANKKTPNWHMFFQLATDIFYIADIIISLMTGIETNGIVERKFVSNIFQRCKRPYFIMDVLSTLWIEKLAVSMNFPEYYNILKFNRLIKTYILFVNSYKNVWNKNKHPAHQVIHTIGLTHFWFGYVLGYLVYLLVALSPALTPYYFYGELCETKPNETTTVCRTQQGVVNIFSSWMYELIFPEHQPSTVPDLILAMIIIIIFFLMHLYTKAKFISALYLKYIDFLNFYFFVSNLKKHYARNKIHPNLLSRLDRFLECHWKYYHGMDILHVSEEKELPHDIYWKLQGCIAEKIISESAPFKYANPAFIRELAYKANFLILPKGYTLKSYGIHSKNISWVVNGSIKHVCFDNEGKLVTSIITDRLITMGMVLLKKASHRTYITGTDCEIMSIRLEDYYQVLKKYPLEHEVTESCIAEVIRLFTNLHFQAFVKKNRDRLIKNHDIGYESESEEMAGSKKSYKYRIKKLFRLLIDFRKNPESLFIRLWMLFRFIVVLISISAIALQGGSGAVIRPLLIQIGSVCNVITFFDIVLKLFLPYYNENGLIISDIKMCMVHYVTRGFILDTIGGLPWSSIINEEVEDQHLTLQLFAEYSHLYILLGYFNYLSDKPSANVAVLMIIKWQLVTILIMLGASHFLVSSCIDFHWDSEFNLLNMTRGSTCWMPNFLPTDEQLTTTQVHEIFAESIAFAQCGFLMINLGKFHITEHKTQTSCSFLLMGAMFWYVICYCQTLLILHYRGNTMFQHGVSQLHTFLKAERVPQDIIDRAVNHFVYIWNRTKGINISILMNERIGTVFRQDVSYFFYKKTFAAADTLLGGGESLEHLLAANTHQIHFLPNEDIIREMELSAEVFIVHRGKVGVYKDGVNLAVLTKGSIFGQITAEHGRPGKITACSLCHADLMTISSKVFQGILSVDIRENIADNPNSSMDYMVIKQKVIENPYNSLEYILRERQSLMLPWMSQPVSAGKHMFYTRWLFLVWLVGPVTSALLVLLLNAMPAVASGAFRNCLIACDILHILHLIFEFYTMEVVVENNQCVKRYLRCRKLLKWTFYHDILSLILPLFSFISNEQNFQLARLLRIHSIYSYNKVFCSNFQTRGASVIVKFVLVILLLHALTYGWINVACRSRTGLYVELKVMPNITLDTDEWVEPKARSDGCLRSTKSVYHDGKFTIAFVVPKQWYADYLIALSYILIIHTNANMDVVVPLTLLQLYYKIFVTIILYLVEMWIASVCISIVYTKIRDMYLFDYHVTNLINYLKQNGISRILLQSVRKYTRLLWQRQRGNWLPEITQLAPACLREDILSSLYVHHLVGVPLFKQLPGYFLKQLCAKLSRVVVFPGHNIVQEGDIYPCIYFIHEGEVEKWFTDARGEYRMSTLLTMNEYFGLIPGLFPDTPFSYTYYSRTIVDLVYLQYEDWQDLLNHYPDIKQKIYTAAMKQRGE